jgi:PKD repeat protein
MRKIYLLGLLVSAFLSIHSRAQDSVRFQVSIGTNNLVNFINTSVLSGPEPRKAFWTFGDGTRASTAPLAGIHHQYAANGTYTACLRIFKYISNTNDSIITGEACRTFTLGNSLADSCKAGFTDTHTSASTLQKRFVAQPWHNNNRKPEQICWNFGDNQDTCINYDPSQPHDYVVNHTYSQPGQYNVCVKIKYQGGCQATYCRIVNTAMGGDTCKAEFTLESLNSSTHTKKFTAQPWHMLQKKPTLVCWIFGDGTDTCVQYGASYIGPYTVTHTYPGTGQYNACVKIRYEGGCEVQKCKLVSVAQTTNPTPDSCFLDITAVVSSPSNPVRHFYASTNPNRVAEKICWNFGDGTDTCIILPNPLTSQSLLIAHHYPGPGVYHICAKVWYAGGCIGVKCREVVIRSTTNLCGGFMTDSLTGIRTLQFKGFPVMNTNDHVVNWRWTFGDGTTAQGQHVSHTYAAGGNYEVCLTIVTNLGCETRICKKIPVYGSTTNLAPLQISPNPVVNTLHAVFHSALQEQVTIKIYNASGIVVYQAIRNVIAGQNNWDIDLSSLPPGLYSMVVHSPSQIANAVFFKQ